MTTPIDIRRKPEPRAMHRSAMELRLLTDVRVLKAENAQLRRTIEAALTASVMHWKENRQLKIALAARRPPSQVA